MAKKTFEERYEGDINKSLEVIETLKRTPAFKEFCQTQVGTEALDGFLNTDEGQSLAKSLSLKRFGQEPVGFSWTPTKGYCFQFKRVATILEEADGELIIKIDKTASRLAIESDLKMILDFHHKKHGRQSRGQEILKKDEVLNMFKAYDAVIEEGGNFQQATYRIFPETEGTNPTYDPETMRKYKLVRSWHNKIKNLLKTVKYIPATPPLKTLLNK